MKPRILAAGLGALVLLSFSHRLPAQRSGFVFAGGGLTVPRGDFKTIDLAKTGWIASGGGGVNLSKSVWIEAEGWYGSNTHNDGTGDRTNLTAGLAAVGYELSPDAKGSAYVLGGGGMMINKLVLATGTSVSSTKMALSGAAGFLYQLSKRTHLWVEGRYMHTMETGGTTIIPITAGLSFNLGKRK